MVSVEVSIIILSYNTEALLKRCLTSIFAKIKNIPFEVIVVDNNSHDNSVSMVKKDFPKVTLVGNKKNIGFAAGCNRGAKEAKGEYLFFLNSDTEFTDNALEKLLRAFKKYPDAAIVGGMLENLDGSLQRSYGAFYTIPNVFLMLFGGDKAEIKRFKNNAIHKVDWVTGGCMLVKRSVFKELGGLDEHFFMYVEDMELCYRAYLQGMSTYIDPSSIVKHVGQGSSSRGFAIAQIFKGLSYFYKKHGNRLEYTMVIVLLFIKAAVSILIGAVTFRPSLVKTYLKAVKAL